MTTTTTLSAMSHLVRETGRFDRVPGSGGDSAFSALVPQGGAQEWNVPTPVPTPVPTDLHTRFWAEAPTPPPSTDFEDDQSRTSMATPTPLPIDPEDDSIRTSAPTPVPTVPPEEDAAALTHRLAQSLLTGAEFQFAGIVRGSGES